MKDRKNSSLLRRLEKFQRLFFVALLSVLAVGALHRAKPFRVLSLTKQVSL